jgi:alpha-1,6-mannosyltransferase
MWRQSRAVAVAGCGVFSVCWQPSGAWLLVLLGCLSTWLYTREYTLATYPWVFFPLFGLYGVALLLVWRQVTVSSPVNLAVILVFAVVFRLVTASSPLILSTDLYRYVWDGRVQRAGINPYRYPPQAEALAPLRDAEIHARVNRPWLPTIYPPVAQMFFALSAWVAPDSIRGMKAIMMLVDLSTIAVLIRLLKTAGHPLQRVLLYAWSPLVVFEFAGSGHVDVLMIPFILLAVQARLGQRPGLSGVMLGLATLTKLYPVVLLPALYTKREWRLLMGFSATLVLGYLPYVLGGGTQVLGYLSGYFGPWEDFNGGLRHFLTVALTPCTDQARLLAAAVCATLLLGVAYVVSRLPPVGDWIQRAASMIAAYLLLVPTTFYPWYIIWLLPFLCFTPSWGWLYLSGAGALAYVAEARPNAVLPLGIHLLEFLPLYVLLLAQAVWQRWSWVYESTMLLRRFRTLRG